MNWMIYAALAVPLSGAVYAALCLIKRYMSRLTDRRIFAFQSDLITKHCAEVEHIYSMMRGWRHDYHQHMQALTAFLALEQYGEIGVYISKLNDDLSSVDTVIKTGNTMVDAILNSKVSLARSKGIEVNVKAMVPGALRISEIDICVIIGNLIDNAAEACERLQPGQARVIRVYVDIFREQLYISVSNTSGGDIIKEGARYVTTKGANHGFGLMRVDAIAAKYGGWVNRQHEEGVFATELMLPL